MRGHIAKRGKNSFSVVVYLGRDPQTGKERRKWYSCKTRRAAERELSRLVGHLHGGGTIAPGRVRVDTFLDDWLRGHAPHLAPTTVASYRDTIRKHLRPAFGHLTLDKLIPQTIRDYIPQKLAVGLSETTVRYHTAILREALQQAVKDGLLPRNPCDTVAAPRKRRQELRVLDTEQVRIFLAEAKRGSQYYPLYLAALMTGMRQGELLGLRWRDVDLTLGFASIQQTFYRLHGSKADGIPTQQLFKPPKTEKARRQVALSSVIVEALWPVREQQRELRRLFGKDYHDHDLIFCQPNGKPLHAHNVAQRDLPRVLGLKTLREDAKKRGVPEDLLPKPLPRVSFHSLRHSHATLLLQQGVHPRVVQERLGHSTISMTLDTYSHTVPGMQADAARRLEEALFI